MPENMHKNWVESGNWLILHSCSTSCSALLWRKIIERKLLTENFLMQRYDTKREFTDRTLSSYISLPVFLLKFEH